MRLGNAEHYWRFRTIRCAMQWAVVFWAKDHIPNWSLLIYTGPGGVTLRFRSLDSFDRPLESIVSKESLAG